MKTINQIIRKTGILFTFYRYFMWVSLLMNAGCAYFLWKNGMSAYATLFWLKIFSMGASLYLVNDFRKQEYFYFYNFGLSKKMLWITTLSFDLVLFFVFIILAYQLR